MTLVLIGASLLMGAAQLDEPIRPIPAAVHQDPARVAIGRRLFNEVRLSGNNRIACSNCHDLKHGGADHGDRSKGFTGKLTAVNTPTVLNAALNFNQFWDGRSASLESQVDNVVNNPVEMGSNWADVVKKLSQDTEYRLAFGAAYANGITAANIENAIATFERTLLTPNSRFDRYLRGEADAITAIEREGYAKFKQYGCVSCHQGVNIGGNMFQKFGVMGDYFANRGHPTDADLGRYQVTHDESDRNVFKVPSLRNVALTAPYFHDAAAKTLGDAVDLMFKYQLGRVASDDDKRAIVSFLETLTGEQAKEP